MEETVNIKSTNTQTAEEEKLVIELTKEYMFEGKKYTKVDLTGLNNLTAEDMIAANRVLSRNGNVDFLQEMTLEYACVLASKGYARYEDETGIYYLVAGTVQITGINGIELNSPEIKIEAATKLTERAEQMSTSADTWSIAAPEIKIGEASEDGESVTDIAVTSTANVTYEAEGKKLDVNAEEIKHQAKAEMYFVSEADLKLEDDSWSTSLKKIMERLAALDGDQSDKK